MLWTPHSWGGHGQDSAAPTTGAPPSSTPGTSQDIQKSTWPASPHSTPKRPFLGALVLVSWAEAAFACLCSLQNQHLGCRGFLLLRKPARFEGVEPDWFSQGFRRSREAPGSLPSCSVFRACFSGRL